MANLGADSPPPSWGSLFSESPARGGDAAFHQPVLWSSFVPFVFGTGLLGLACSPLLDPDQAHLGLLKVYAEIPGLLAAAFAVSALIGAVLIGVAMVIVWARRSFVVDVDRGILTCRTRTPFRVTEEDVALERLELISLDEYATRDDRNIETPIEIPPSSSGHLWIQRADASPLSLGRGGIYTSISLARRIQEVTGLPFRLRRDYHVTINDTRPSAMAGG